MRDRDTGRITATAADILARTVETIARDIENDMPMTGNRKRDLARESCDKLGIDWKDKTA